MHTEKVRYKFVQLWPNNKNSDVQVPSIGQKSVRFLNPTVSRQYRLSKSADSSRKQEAPVHSSYDSRSNSCSCGPQNRIKATAHGRVFSLVNNKTLSHSNRSLQHSYQDSCKVRYYYLPPMLLPPVYKSKPFTLKAGNTCRAKSASIDPFYYSSNLRRSKAFLSSAASKEDCAVDRNDS